MKKIFGVAYYYEHQWAKLREISEDPEKLFDTWAEWFSNVQKHTQELERNGVTVHKCYIDVNALAVWCEGRALKINSNTRADYANHILASSFGHDVKL